jgi:hypothetical protein
MISQLNHPSMGWRTAEAAAEVTPKYSNTLERAISLSA